MKILVINGPNLNMLGKRPKEHYGTLTLDEINNIMLSNKPSNFQLDFYQSNYEGDIVTKIQEALSAYDGIIINPAAYTHTSVAIHDALEMFSGPIVEVHLSHVDDREGFRRVNFIRDVATKTFSGKKEMSYVEAVNFLNEYFNNK